MQRTGRPTEDKGRRQKIVHKLAFGVLAAFAVLLVGLSFLPVIDSYRWWIRLADFPRLQIGIALLVLVIPIAFYWRRFPKVATILMTSMAAAVAYHGYVLRPYAPTGPEFFASHCPSGNLVSILIANVKMHNDPQGKLIEIVRAADPDIFLAMETNAKWDRALAPLADDMPHTVAKISDSQYGIHLFSRLELVSPEIQYFAGQDTPQVVTGVTLRNGEVIDFLGIHPRPPLPSESSLGRDAVLYSAALKLRDSTRPGIIAGDFNATPGSRLPNGCVCWLNWSTPGAATVIWRPSARNPGGWHGRWTRFFTSPALRRFPWSGSIILDRTIIPSWHGSAG